MDRKVSRGGVWYVNNNFFSSVSPISLSTTYLSLDMLMFSICPVPLALLGDRLFVRFWGDIYITFLIEVGYSRSPPPLVLSTKTPKHRTKSVLIGKMKTRTLLESQSILKNTFIRHPPSTIYKTPAT